MLDDVIQIQLNALESEMGRIAFKALCPQEKLQQIKDAVEPSLLQLKSHVLEYPFTSEEDEIYFFKHVKPQFYCWKIYASERYKLELAIPKSCDELKRAFLMGQIGAIDRFFRGYYLHYNYYRMGVGGLDELFFLRSSSLAGIGLFPSEQTREPGFETRGDYLFAKFMAMEKLASWIQQQIFGLHGFSPLIRDQVSSKS